MTTIASSNPKRDDAQTDAAWQVTKAMVDNIALGARWLNNTMVHLNARLHGRSSQDEVAVDMLAACKEQLWTLVHVLITAHLPNRALDMSGIINIVLVPVIQDFGLVDCTSPFGALAYAMLKRAAEDETVFSSTSGTEDTWQSKADTVSVLWSVSCKHCTQVVQFATCT